MLMGVADDLSHTRQGREFFGRTLGIASGDDNLRLGIFSVHASNRGSSVLVGGSGDGAGVQYDNVRCREVADAFQTAFLELTFDGGTVGLGGATTKILYVKTSHDTIVAAQSARIRSGLVAKQVDSRSIDRELELRCAGDYHDASRAVSR